MYCPFGQEQDPTRSTFSAKFSNPICFHLTTLVLRWNCVLSLTNHVWNTCLCFVFAESLYLIFLMKRNCLHLPHTSCFFVMVAILSCAFLSFSSTTVSAQATASVATPISVADLPQEPQWKSSVEYSAVLAAERANAAQSLAAPTTKELGFALYTGYDLSLIHI